MSTSSHEPLRARQGDITVQRPSAVYMKQEPLQVPPAPVPFQLQQHRPSTGSHGGKVIDLTCSDEEDQGKGKTMSDVDLMDIDDEELGGVEHTGTSQQGPAPVPHPATKQAHTPAALNHGAQQGEGHVVGVKRQHTQEQGGSVDEGGGMEGKVDEQGSSSEEEEEEEEELPADEWDLGSSSSSSSSSSSGEEEDAAMEEVAFGEEGHKGLTPPPDMAPAAAPTDQPPVAAAEAAEAPAAVISSAVQLAKERARLAGLSALPALGARIKVYWSGSRAWYPGTVIHIHDNGRQHRVKYDDGEVRDCDLRRSSREFWPWCFLHQAPAGQQPRKRRRRAPAVAHTPAADEEGQGRLLAMPAGARQPGGRQPGHQPAAQGQTQGRGGTSRSSAAAGAALAESYAQLASHLATWEATGGQAPHRVLQGAARQRAERRVGRNGILYQAFGVCVYRKLRPLEPFLGGLRSFVPLVMDICHALCPGIAPRIKRDVKVVVLVPAGTPGVTPGDAEAAAGGHSSPGSSAAIGSSGASRAAGATAATAVTAGAGAGATAAAAAGAAGAAGAPQGPFTPNQVPGHWQQVAAVTCEMDRDAHKHCYLYSSPLREPLQTAVPGGYLLATLVVGAAQGSREPAGASSSRQAAGAGGAGPGAAAQPHLELYVVPEALVAPSRLERGGAAAGAGSSDGDQAAGAGAGTTGQSLRHDHQQQQQQPPEEEGAQQEEQVQQHEQHRQEGEQGAEEGQEHEQVAAEHQPTPSTQGQNRAYGLAKGGVDRGAKRAARKRLRGVDAAGAGAEAEAGAEGRDDTAAVSGAAPDDAAAAAVAAPTSGMAATEQGEHTPQAAAAGARAGGQQQQQAAEAPSAPVTPPAVQTPESQVDHQGQPSSPTPPPAAPAAADVPCTPAVPADNAEAAGPLRDGSGGRGAGPTQPEAPGAGVVALVLQLPDAGDFGAGLPHLMQLLWQLLIQVPSLRHEGLTRLLATRDPTQQQALMGLYYPLLQLVVGQGDVGLVADMVEDISDSLAAAPADAAAGAAGQGPAAPAAASGGGGGGGAGLAAGAGSAVELPNVGDNFRAARVHLLQLLRQMLTQVPELRHQGLIRLLASCDQAQQQAFVKLPYPLLQQRVGTGDVESVADMIQSISNSLRLS